MQDTDKRYLVFQGQSIQDSNELDTLVAKQKANGVRVEEYESAINLLAVEESKSLVNIYVNDSAYDNINDELKDVQSEYAADLYRHVLPTIDDLRNSNKILLDDVLYDNGLDPKQ